MNRLEKIIRDYVQHRNNKNAMAMLTDEFVRKKWNSIVGARNRARLLTNAFQDDYSHLIAEWCKDGFFVCSSCQKKLPAPALSIHHKIRLNDGGSDSSDNVQAVCWSCHNHFNKYGVAISKVKKSISSQAPYNYKNISPFRKIIKRKYCGKITYYYYPKEIKGYIKTYSPLPNDYKINDKTFIINDLQ